MRKRAKNVDEEGERDVLWEGEGWVGKGGEGEGARRERRGGREREVEGSLMR